jgi:signal peptidase II
MALMNTEATAAEITTESSTARPHYLLVAIVSLLVIGLDQLTKLYILRTFSPGEVLAIIPNLFNLTLTFNPGAAFGLWGQVDDGWRQLILGVTTCIALGVVLYFLKQPAYRNKLAQTALASILGGAVGNIIDRTRLNGTVVDFLDFYWGTNHWPAFNVADSAICVGVFLLIVLPQRH